MLLSNFRKILLNSCETEFHKVTSGNSEISQKARGWFKFFLTLPPLQRSCCLLAFALNSHVVIATKLSDDEMVLYTKSKTAMVGNIKFIGELFKLKLLPPNIIYSCTKYLLQHSTDEACLECIVALLTTCGGMS